jgi:hypothetical protein
MDTRRHTVSQVRDASDTSTVPPEDYWARMQSLREDLARLRGPGAGQRRASAWRARR